MKEIRYYNSKQHKKPDFSFSNHRRHLKLNKCGWDIMLTKEQVQDIIANLQKMIQGKEISNG